jgi:hypothetical protein
MLRKPVETTPRPIPDDELQRLAEDHLRYELQQMALGTFRRRPSEQYLANVIQEAFLVHVRVLDDFLGKDGAWGEDASGSSGERDTDWRETSFGSSTSSRGNLRRISPRGPRDYPARPGGPADHPRHVGRMA